MTGGQQVSPQGVPAAPGLGTFAGPAFQRSGELHSLLRLHRDHVVAPRSHGLNPIPAVRKDI